jgi:Lysozyme like domain
VLFFLGGKSMKKDQKFLIGVLTFVFAVAIFANKANALSVENNLLSTTTQTVSSTAHKAVFLVSKPQSLVKVKKDLKVLYKYQDAVSLTDRELKQLLHAVGFRGQGLVKAWAVAKKESNGRPLAFNGNVNTGDNSYGIFQINMLGMLKEGRQDKFGLNFNSELLNPVINAQVAYHMSAGGKNWSAWHGVTPKTKAWMKKFPS